MPLHYANHVVIEKDGMTDADCHNKIHYVSVNDLFLFGIDARILGMSKVT